MITAWDVYWITRLDAINVMAVGMFITLTLTTLFSLIPVTAQQMWDWEIWPRIKRAYKISFVLWLVALLLLILLPSTKEALQYTSSPKIANNEQVPDNFAKLPNVKMEEWMKDAIIEKVEKK